MKTSPFLDLDKLKFTYLHVNSILALKVHQSSYLHDIVMTVLCAFNALKATQLKRFILSL